MKRIIIIILAALIAFPAAAQLNVKAKAKIEKLGSLRMGVIDVMQSNKIYIGFSTTNRFDDPCIFYLGDTKESALTTMEEILDFYDNADIDEYMNVQANPEDECIMSISSEFGVPVLHMQFDGRAGYQNFSAKELERIYKIIDDKAQ